MKKINLISLISAFVLLFSCSEQEVRAQEELVAVNAETALNQEKFRCRIGPEIYGYITDNTLEKLRELESEFLERLEEGDEGVIEDLESTQRSLSQFEDLNEYLIRIVIPPLPPRPKGCIIPEIKDGRFPLNSVNQSVLLLNDIKLINIEFGFGNNERFDADLEIGEDSFGNSVLFFRSEFEGNATMYFTIETEATGVMTLELDVFKD